MIILGGVGVAFNENVDLFFERCPQYFLYNFVCLDARLCYIWQPGQVICV